MLSQAAFPLREENLICCICVAWRAPRKYSYTVFKIEIRWNFPFVILKADLHLEENDVALSGKASLLE